MAPELLIHPLPTRILHLLTQDRTLAYAQIAPDLTVLTTSKNLREFLSPIEDHGGEVEGRYIGDLFLEFAGAESELSAVLNGFAPGYRIGNANREQPDGTVRYLTLRIDPLDETNPGAGLLLTVEDNTDIGRLEQMLVQERNTLRLTQARLARANTALTRLDQMKSLFLSIAAHDLRAPLSAIRGYASLIHDEDPVATDSVAADRSNADREAERREFSATIISLVDDLNRLITDLLDLEIIEKGKLLVRPITCDLTSMVSEVCQSLLPVAVDHGLQLSFEDPGGRIFVLADPERVQQILYNLIGNAIKYTPGGGTIRATCWQEEQSGVLQIADNGRGIIQEELSQVFELYHRSAEAMQSQTRGAGLGLYIVKSLVDAQGGNISVSSQAELGTVFTVRVPRPTMIEPGE